MPIGRRGGVPGGGIAFALAALFGVWMGALAWGVGSAAADEAAAPDFVKQVLPILEAKCIRCHGANRKGGKLDMRTREAMLAGGASGPAFKPGNAAKSLMIEMIHYGEMPPKKEVPRVSKEELELLKSWVQAGAPAPK